MLLYCYQARERSIPASGESFSPRTAASLVFSFHEAWFDTFLSRCWDRKQMAEYEYLLHGVDVIPRTRPLRDLVSAVDNRRIGRRRPSDARPYWAGRGVSIESRV